MHDLIELFIELFCDLEELAEWILPKTILAVWYWLFPTKDMPDNQSRSSQ